MYCTNIHELPSRYPLVAEVLYEPGFQASKQNLRRHVWSGLLTPRLPANDQLLQD